LHSADLSLALMPHTEIQADNGWWLWRRSSGISRYVISSYMISRYVISSGSQQRRPGHLRG
jgi:hypothetical protein